MDEHRAHALIDVKSVDKEKRILTGIATNPTADKVGDIVMPKGAQFKLPIPFLYQHQHDKPVGHVTKAKVTDAGIEVEVQIARVSEPGLVKDRVDSAWHDIKYGLVGGLSIGFQPIESEPIKGSYGSKFVKWLWHELSAVTVPAGMGTDIQTIKSLDREILAASGRSDEPSIHPAASGESPKPVVKRMKTMAQKKSTADQIAEWEATRVSKAAEMKSIMEGVEGETLEADAQEAFDAIEAEMNEIDGHIKRLRVMERFSASSAKAVDGSTSEKAAESRGSVPAQVKAPEPEKGIRFARYVKCLGLAHKTHRDPATIAQEMYGERDPKMVDVVKAAVIASNTTTDAALIGNEGGWADFVEFLRPRTILGRFGTDGIPGLTRIPFRVPLITEATESAAYWVAEGKAKPLTKPSWTRTEMSPLKVANIAVATMEQLRDSSPSGELLIRNSLVKAIAKAQDQAFIDPTNAGTAGAKPAAITNGLSSNAFAATGQDIDAIDADVATAQGKFIAANNDLTSGVWVMSSLTALSLSMVKNTMGNKEYPEISIRGGTFHGLPVITSQHVGNYVALVNAEDIYLGDEGGIAVDMSTEASLEMMDNPTGDSIATTPVAAEMVSLWQTNSVGFRAERTVNWMRRRTTAVSLITGVTWGVGAS